MIAAIAVAAISNAASFDWKLQTGLDYAGMDVYAVSGSTAANVLTALQSTDAASWTAALDGVTGFEVTGSNNRAGASGKSNGIAGGDNLVFVIVDGAVAEGSKYWVVNDYSIPAASTYEPPASGSIVTVKLTDQGVAGSGTLTAVPEPTSGLLMLVGLGALALRRRRA